MGDQRIINKEKSQDQAGVGVRYKQGRKESQLSSLLQRRAKMIFKKFQFWDSLAKIKHL